MSYAEIHKTSSFALIDLLLADVKTTGCTCKGVKFSNVLVCGIVVVEPSSVNNDKLVFTVDDGTATIKCMTEIRKGPLVTRITEMHKSLEAENKSSVSGNSAFFNAALLTITNTTRLLALTDCSSLKLGEKVRVTGKLRTFQNVPYIFINRIERIKKPKQFEDYLKQQFCLYDRVYKSNS